MRLEPATLSVSQAQAGRDIQLSLLSVRPFFGTCRVRFLLTLEATPSRRCTWPGKPGLSLRFLQMTLTFSERAQKLARPNQVR